jgi:hypothetical protein
MKTWELGVLGLVAGLVVRQAEKRWRLGKW